MQLRYNLRQDLDGSCSEFDVFTGPPADAWGQTRSAVLRMENEMQASAREKSDNINKDPDEWTTGDEPMTPLQLPT